MPEIQVPLATYTGWNMRSAQIGAPGEMFSMVGSVFPFSKTKAERVQQHDSRPSIEERYADRAQYLQLFGSAARRLVESGYLLDRDVPALLERAGEEWDLYAR